MPKKPVFTKEDFFRQLDQMLMMPGQQPPGGQGDSVFSRIRQAVQRKNGLKPPKV